MRKFQRAALICFVGLCFMGLVLVGGERFQIKGSDMSTRPADDGTTSFSGTFCPVYLFGQFNGAYVYYAYDSNLNQCSGPYSVADYRLHTLGTSCTDCPDPITGNAHPLPAGNSESELAPKPDSLFSGVLR